MLLIIISLQVGYFIFRSFDGDEPLNSFSQDLKTQAKIDVLNEAVLKKDSIKIYSFNPNFVTDYKGYTLGMSIEEIDRLHAFRAKNKYVNSSEEFQQVTFISDSLLNTIAPFFKFPEWTKNRTPYTKKNGGKPKTSIKENVVVKDLNAAAAGDLKMIYGIGEKLSARIVKFRDRLGGFLVDEQLYDVYGLEPEVVQRVLRRYKVQNPPQIEKININIASVEMLTKLIYLQRSTAISIVEHRNSQGSIKSFEELSKIENFPIEKIDRIALYLSL